MDMAQTKPSTWRKVAISAGMSAALTWFLLAALVPLFADGPLSAMSASERVSGGVGLIYVLFAVFVGAGAAGPRIGAQFLNVEDEDDLRQQRQVLAYAAAAMAMIGSALVVLALAGPGGVLARPTALAAALALFAASVPLTLFQWRLMDELLRSVTVETGNLSYYLILLGGGGWAMLAHLDFAAAPAPLDWLTMFSAITLAASFVATMRRGLHQPH